MSVCARSLAADSLRETFSEHISRELAYSRRLFGVVVGVGGVLACACVLTLFPLRCLSVHARVCCEVAGTADACAYIGAYVSIPLHIMYGQCASAVLAQSANR